MDPKIFLGNDNQVVILLLLFITALLTKRIVPWWVHNEALEKLKAYEDAAPKLITEIQNLMESLHQQEQVDNTAPRTPRVRSPRARPYRTIRKEAK
jgi:hypothetical protein